ncbi:hypothetical protein P10VF_005 [Rhizobium phage vB_RleM_P10VF]|uniref:Uncharacterized protein n=1 Tax=Rhizobium phage vB_RleM_P10VF TaxID=1527770 RepID=A0A076YII1_9CAUD|nr:hypothetical protein P10VF_005 [Rhizobium phage vB_RleM_P10VF]AIK68218.1 hypothetical protein P10VF_005 [Rhizobium phage vB_RleM_P10VF]
MTTSKAKNNSIWVLFSIDNNYDQPGHNLVGWWMTRPTLETIAKAVGVKFPSDRDEETVAVVKIWNGEVIDLSDTEYRLRKIEEGTKLDAELASMTPSKPKIELKDMSNEDYRS